MISVQQLIDQISELQGEVWIRQWDYEKDDYSFNQSLDIIEPYHPIFCKPIKYIYSGTLPKKHDWDSPESALFIEVEDDN